jgi:glycosyltransferase involved in cell wall biosynthesis
MILDKGAIKISLVICTYNRDRYLPEALESIKNQSFDKNLFELIIVDNNSTDSTENISRKFISENPSLNIKYCFEERKGLSFARNRGVGEAEASIITYVDDDVILSPSFLDGIAVFFDTYKDAVGAGGKVIPKYESDREPEWMNKYLNGFVGKVDHGDKVLQYNDGMKYPAGCNMTYRKEILLKAGGFNTELTFRSDDKYIFYQVKKISDEIYYVPDAWLFHYIDSYRLTKNNFKKLFLKTGNEEKRRLYSEKGTIGLIKKLFEFVIKFFASIMLFILFSIKGQSVKGKYVVMSQWYTLMGFLQKDVFVR